MKTIPLTQGKVALVDDQDYAALVAHKWYATKRYGGIWYAARQENKRRMYMHRELLRLGPGEWADHIDRDGLNNQRANLRHITPQQNLCNKRIYRNNKTGFRGVAKKGDRFRAQITAFGRTHYLGYYGTVEEAARAYDEHARRFFGDFAQLNFPDKTGRPRTVREEEEQAA
jgi:hypothetical protein